MMDDDIELDFDEEIGFDDETQTVETPKFTSKIEDNSESIQHKIIPELKRDEIFSESLDEIIAKRSQNQPVKSQRDALESLDDIIAKRNIFIPKKSQKKPRQQVYEENEALSMSTGESSFSIAIKSDLETASREVISKIHQNDSIIDPRAMRKLHAQNPHGVFDYVQAMAGNLIGDRYNMNLQRQIRMEQGKKNTLQTMNTAITTDGLGIDKKLYSIGTSVRMNTRFA